jgi:hypothetical protein
MRDCPCTRDRSRPLSRRVIDFSNDFSSSALAGTDRFDESVGTRPGPWAIFVKVAGVRFRCDIRHSTTTAQRGAVIVRKWDTREKKRKEKGITYRTSIYRSRADRIDRPATGSGANAGWGCESKRPGMYGPTNHCDVAAIRFPKDIASKAVHPKSGEKPRGDRNTISITRD